MSIKECRKKSKEILKGKYAEGFVVSFALISVLLMFKTIDLMLASAAVYAQAFFVLCNYGSGSDGRFMVVFSDCFRKGQ